MKQKLMFVTTLCALAVFSGCSKSPKVESYSKETTSTDVNGMVDTKTTTDVNGDKHTTESHSVAP